MFAFVINVNKERIEQDVDNLYFLCTIKIPTIRQAVNINTKNTKDNTQRRTVLCHRMYRMLFIKLCAGIKYLQRKKKYSKLRRWMRTQSTEHRTRHESLYAVYAYRVRSRVSARASYSASHEHASRENKENEIKFWISNNYRTNVSAACVSMC